MLVKSTIPVVLIIFLFFAGCGKKLTPDEEKYVKSIEQSRIEKNDYMKNDKSSPFNQDPNAHFSDLKYFDVDPEFVFRSRLYPYEVQDTVSVFGTKGEERKAVRIGFVLLGYKGTEYRLNVYKGFTKQGTEYYSIWFTDQTTGEETYGVGRYIDFEYVPDTSHIYTIDFNLAYNPYCAYSAKFSCAIPTKEDHIAFGVEAGEKSFH